MNLLLQNLHGDRAATSEAESENVPPIRSGATVNVSPFVVGATASNQPETHMVQHEEQTTGIARAGEQLNAALVKLQRLTDAGVNVEDMQAAAPVEQATGSWGMPQAKGDAGPGPVGTTGCFGKSCAIVGSPNRGMCHRVE